MTPRDPFEFLANFTLKISLKRPKKASFSFSSIALDITKMLTSCFHWWATSREYQDRPI